MKLGVICDGISRDLAHAVDVMDEFDLTYAELQFVGDTEVGDHSAEEIKAIDTLLRDRGKPVSCLSRHIFAGMTGANKPGDELHTKHMDALKRVIDPTSRRLSRSGKRRRRYRLQDSIAHNPGGRESSRNHPKRSRASSICKRL